MPIGDKVEGIGTAGVPTGGVVTVQGPLGASGDIGSRAFVQNASGVWIPAIGDTDGAQIVKIGLPRAPETPMSVASVSIAMSNVAVSATLVAAPGANLQIRVFAFKATLTNGAAAGLWNANFTDGAGGTSLWRAGLQQPGFMDSQMSLAPYFLDLTTNTLLQVNTIGSIAGPTTGTFHVWYQVVAA